MSLSFWDAPWSLLGQSAPLWYSIRFVSIISLIIGVISIFPIVLLVMIDIVLYIWRLFSSHVPSRRRESLGQAIQDAAPTPHINAGSTTALDARHGSQKLK